MNRNKVSIVITTYNGEKTILRAVESCINQSYNNLEIIVVDDNGIGSLAQRKTQEILKKYINSNTITYITHEINRNASVARNTGVNKATGKYIALLDDDDYFFEDKILNQVNAFEKLGNEYGIVYCSMLNNMENKIYEHQATYEGDVLFDFGMMRVSACTSNIMFRKKDFIEIGGFDESYSRHQDWEFLIRMANKKKFFPVKYIGTQKNTISVMKKINLENTEKYRLKYINLLLNEISRLSKKKQNNIIAHEYNEIAKTFFRHQKFKICFKYIFIGKRIDWFIRDLFLKPFRKINMKWQQRKYGKIIIKS